MMSKLPYGGFRLGCALFYKPIWQLTVNERGHYADSEDTFLFKIEDSPGSLKFRKIVLIIPLSVAARIM